MKARQTILIVDDNPNNIRLAADSLKMMDVSIVFAKSGAKALNIMNDEKIDLVLMDINMPGLDGFETTRRIKKEVPVIFLTALDDKESVLRAFEEGGVDYITKPFYPAELKARVATHLKLARLNQNLAKEVDKKTRALQQSLTIDHVTGAYNASQLYMDLKETSKKVAVMVHIRGLKEYEIAFGLEWVEKVMMTFVGWLKNQEGFSDKIYTHSYGDFICLFETEDVKKIETYCHQLHHEQSTLGFEVDGSMLNLNLVTTIATGCCGQLIQHLRIAAQEAKNHNLDFYVFDQEGLEVIKQQKKNIYWINFLMESFKKDTIVPFFQPIVESSTGKIVKYECLARIKDGDSIISPFFFIDAAKKLGAVTRITRIMIEKSLKVFASSKMDLSLNITKEDLMEAYLVDLLDTMCQKYHLEKSQITLEVLEDVSVFGDDKVIDELLRLKKEGYKIALDDFGSENASFSRMLDLQVDIVKIDGSFIKNIHTHKNSRLIVEGIIHIAKLFNHEVVAEFVHNEEVLEVINELGIKRAQGYHFAPPLEKPPLL